jgi:hypothetical protein
MSGMTVRPYLALAAAMSLALTAAGAAGQDSPDDRGKPPPAAPDESPSVPDSPATPANYDIVTFDEDPPRVEIQRDGVVAYQYTYIAPFPRLYPDPPADLTGNGLANLVIADQVSRSTTNYIVLELGPDEVQVLASFPGVWFYQDLEFEDTDGDGIAEPVVIGELR